MRIRGLLVTVLFLSLGSGLVAQQLYFEDPRTLAGGQARFPDFLTASNRLLVIYQESERLDAGARLYLSLATSPDGRDWTVLDRRIGPIAFAGEREPVVYNAIVDSRDHIYAAVTESAEETRVYRSTDGGRSFSEVHRVVTEQTNVAPRLAETSDGSIVLFVNQNLNGRQQVVFTHSPDGTSWTSPQPLEPRTAIGLTFLPRHATVAGRDYVVYQGLNIAERFTYQLYLRISDDGGRTWGSPRRITDFGEPQRSPDPDDFDNQRPDIAADPDGSQLLVAWERRFNNGNPQIYLLGLNRDGTSNGTIEEVTGTFDLARSPQIGFDEGEPLLVWFTNPQGNSRIVIGRRGGFRWQAETLSPLVGQATFAEIVRFADNPHIVWQRQAGEAQSEVVYVEPDQSVEPPGVTPVNFRSGARSASNVARFAFQDPPDAAGILGYGYVWSRDPDADVPRELVQRVPDRTAQAVADEDGPWYLRVRATDFAGNWSQPTTVTYFRDTTPPGPVSFPPPSVDENGYLSTNSFQVAWNPPEGDDPLAGYAVRLDFLAADTAVSIADLPAPEPPARVSTREPVTSAVNLENGSWLLTVAAVDSVGNIGPPRALPLRLNKYVATTQVFSTTVRRDRLGRYELALTGRGFTSDGDITQVFLDRDGEPPYDLEFNAWQDQFRLVSDRQLDGVLVDRVETGTYSVGLVHSERGEYLAPQRLQLNEAGVITFGDFTPVFQPVYREGGSRFGALASQDVLFLIIVASAVLLIAVSSVRLVAIGGEMRRLNLQARALIAQQSPQQIAAQGERISHMKVQGIGLRIKFTFFVVLLLMGVVVLLAVVLGRNVLQRQERILVNGLGERIELLVEGQVTGARPALVNPQLNLDQLQNLAAQGEVMTEARYVTITGLDDAANRQTVYASNDPAIVDPSAEQSRIDTDTYIVGISRVTDDVTDEIERLAEELNAAARAELGSLAAELAQLSREAQQLIVQGATEDEIAQIDRIRTELLRRAQQRLTELAGPIRSSPQFDFEDLNRENTDFLFYKPVLDLPAGAGADFTEYYRGTVRVGISTQLILDEIDSTRRDLIFTTGIIATIAVAFGVLGAILLATIVVRPINRLVGLVEMISAAEDKSSLKGQELDLRTRDELNVLANSINTMMAGLVKAAEADKDLKFGKETQKAFIPLEPITDDTKRTFGKLETPNAYFFGYYEGAKGVSGDYFAYRQLSDRYFAVIKCDVAGKGIPAALIMVQVATVFQDYFRNWTPKTPGINVEALALRINDIVAEVGFKGRFAALTALILDAQQGKAHLANAGDTKLFIFRQNQMAVETLTVAGGPAAGQFSSSDLPLTFPQATQTLSVGDMLLLYTDGLEEAQRRLRRPDWTEFSVSEDMFDDGKIPDDYEDSYKEGFEEFSNDRIHEIVAAVRRRATYTLERAFEPQSDEPLDFDYSTCVDDARDSALAIVAAERVFRLVAHPEAGPEDRILVDREVDTFLREHFLGYDRFFSHRLTREGNDPVRDQYVEFSHIREDSQYDDITILVVEQR